MRPRPSKSNCFQNSSALAEQVVEPFGPARWVILTAWFGLA